MAKALYNDFECVVIDGEDTTEWFRIKTGVKQGCNMSGLLFLLVVDWALRLTFQERKHRNNVEVQLKAQSSPYYH